MGGVLYFTSYDNYSINNSIYIFATGSLSNNSLLIIIISMGVYLNPLAIKRSIIRFINFIVSPSKDVFNIDSSNLINSIKLNSTSSITISLSINRRTELL